MTWVFVIMGNTYDIKRGEWRSDTHSLLSAQELWFAVFMTVLYVYSIFQKEAITNESQCSHSVGYST